MPLVILHDLDGDEVMVNTDTLTAAKRKTPDDKSQIKGAFTKLYFVSKDKTMESLGFPDSVRESPAEIVAMSKK
jgi:hypothetical protein